ncbi:MAG: hypothetical protein K8S87_08305, partial [Planctomycetes bacterium]|nr:hypothetical protein [Planctomycetota bacterium]
RATGEKRKTRANEIFNKLNEMLKNEGKKTYPDADIATIFEDATIVISRVHIADFLVKNHVVRNRKEAFNKYLVKCNVTIASQTPQELADYVHSAGGKLFIAHPSDIGEASLSAFSTDVQEQFRIIQEHLIKDIDGLECYHSRHSSRTVQKYIKFCKANDLLISGGSDCHQHPKIQMGSILMPDFVAEQFTDFIIS